MYHITTTEDNQCEIQTTVNNWSAMDLKLWLYHNFNRSAIEWNSFRYMWFVNSFSEEFQAQRRPGLRSEVYTFVVALMYSWASENHYNLIIVIYIIHVINMFVTHLYSNIFDFPVTQLVVKNSAYFFEIVLGILQLFNTKTINRYKSTVAISGKINECYIMLLLCRYLGFVLC